MAVYAILQKARNFLQQLRTRVKQCNVCFYYFCCCCLKRRRIKKLIVDRLTYARYWRSSSRGFSHHVKFVFAPSMSRNQIFTIQMKRTNNNNEQNDNVLLIINIICIKIYYFTEVNTERNVHNFFKITISFF